MTPEGFMGEDWGQAQKPGGDPPIPQRWQNLSEVRQRIPTVLPRPSDWAWQCSAGLKTPSFLAKVSLKPEFSPVAPAVIQAFLMYAHSDLIFEWVVRPEVAYLLDQWFVKGD
jgi:hypothetical protein